MHDMEEKTGLLWAYRMDGMGNGKKLEKQTNIFSETQSGFSWLHLYSDSPNVKEWLSKNHIDLRVIEALTASETRPTTMPLANGILVVLRGVNLNPGADPEDMISVRLWLTDKLVISARKRERRLLSIFDLRGQIDAGAAPTTTGHFLAALSERMADRISDVVDQIDEELNLIETSISDTNIGELRSSLSTSRRQSASLRRYLKPQREALDSLLLNRNILQEQDIHSFRLQVDRMTRYVEDLDLSRERALVLQGELQSRIAEEQSIRMYILSVVAAVFLPLSFLTGVFGMNVAGLPGTDNSNSFLYLTLGMGAIGASLVALMRWEKWL